MRNLQFHPFPFHPFPKEYMLGTGGNFEYFHPGSVIPMFSGTHGNGWEWVGTGERFKGARPEQALFLARSDVFNALGQGP